MWAFTLRRLLYAVPVLLGVSMLVFVLIHLAPGDVVDILVPPEVPKEIADSLRRRFRLDEPIYLQYLAWLGRLMVGDFGVSFFTGRPVAEELFGALGNTLVIALPAALVGFSLGVGLGALAAYNRDTWLDKVFSATAIIGVSLPHYWVGIVLVAIFSVVFNLLPAQGMGFEGVPSSWDQIKHLILPVVTLSLIPMGVTSRLVRANVLEISQSGIRRHLAREGPQQPSRSLPYAQECGPLGLGRDGLAVWLSSGWIDPGRDRVQLAWIRWAAESRNLSP